MVAWLSISGPGVRQDCSNVVSAMQVLGLVGDVTRNQSVDEHGVLEPGCRVLVASGKSDARRLWGYLRSTIDGLQCAHVAIEHREAGCVFDVFADSRCPSKVTDTNASYS